MRFSIVAALLTVLLSVNNVMCQENAPALKDNTFVMAFIRPETHYLGKWQRFIYTEVFRRLGLKPEFRDYPPKRASIEADAGNVDGDAGRISAYADDHPNIIRVGEFIFTVNYFVFAVKPSIPQLNGWDSLKETNYLVSYTRGVTAFENNLPKTVRKENLSDVTEPIQGLKKLISGRVDLFVEEEFGILTLLQTPEFRDSNIRSVGVMESFSVYPYLHKKHAALAPKMAEVIKAMKAEGLVEKYRVMVDKEFGIVRK
jgi:hypothetical protein